MQRVLSASLAPSPDGKLNRDGTLFTGLAYDVSNDGIVGRIDVVDRGVVTGTSQDWIALPQDGSRVAASFLEERDDYGPSYFGDERFTGVAYYFDSSGECAGESEVVFGRRTELSEREWYKSGRPKLVIGAGEYTAWFEDGSLQRKASPSGIDYELILHDDGRLAGIGLGDPALFDLARVSSMALADELTLLGRAIDTRMLRVLCDHTKIARVTELSLIETNLDAAAVAMLASLGGLAALRLEGNASLGLPEAREIKRQRPSCAVVLDDVAVQ